MSWWWRMMLVVVLALTPGGFLLLLAFISARTFRERWRLARDRARLVGAPVSVREVFATVEFKELVRQARMTL
jgi:hypothetical protein